MDPHTTVIREFVEFAYSVDKTKSVKNMHILVSKPKTLSEPIKKKIIEQARKCFTTVDYNNIQDTDVFKFKTGSISLGRLMKRCKTEDDIETFNDYMNVFSEANKEDSEAVNTILKELELDVDSPEATFMRRIFNEIGEEFMDLARSHQEGEALDIQSILPRAAMLFKNGKIMEVMGSFSESNIRMSKICYAVGKLLEKYEAKEQDDSNGESVEGDRPALGEDDA